MNHLAVLSGAYLDLVLSGAKRVESRLMRTRRAPFGRVTAGDTVYFKATGGPVRASATVSRVWEFADLAPAQLDLLRRRFEPRVRAGREYWRLRRNARYACFIEFDAVLRIDAVAPRLFGGAWLCLQDPPLTVRMSA